MDKHSKYRDLLDSIKMKICRAEMGVTNLFQVMLKTLDKAEKEELAMKAKLDAASAHIAELDIDLGKEVDRRDHWEEKATELASHVGKLHSIEVGEHTSANCPVQNAIDFIPGSLTAIQAETVNKFKDELKKSLSALYWPHVEGVCAVVEEKLKAEKS